MTKRPGLVPARAGRRDGPQQSNLPAPRPARPPGGAPKGGAAHRPPSPPRQTDPPAAGQTAPGARSCHTAPAEHAAGKNARRHAAGHEGGPGPGAIDHLPEEGGEEPGRDSPPPLPPHLLLRPAGCRRPSAPRKVRGKSLLPQNGLRRPGVGAPQSQYATRPHAPTRLLPQRPQQAGGPA